MSESTRKNMSEAHLGKVSPNKGKKMSLEARVKMSESKKGKTSNFKGRKHSSEARIKLSEAHIQRSFKVISPEGNIIEETNVRKFCRDNNLHNSNFFKMLDGQCKTCSGYKLAV